jgi:hypothetical protein
MLQYINEGFSLGGGASIPEDADDKANVANQDVKCGHEAQHRFLALLRDRRLASDSG